MKFSPNAENKAIFKKVVQTVKPCSYFAKPFDHPDQPERGTTYWDWDLRLVKDKEGGIGGLIFSTNDVTEAKRTDSKLKELNEELEEMATPFSKKMSDPIMGLTPTEIKVASLVKDGKTNKEIVKLLNKSIRAVTSHRDNIRRKLGLKNKKINLRTYLLSLN